MWYAKGAKRDEAPTAFKAAILARRMISSAYQVIGLEHNSAWPTFQRRQENTKERFPRLWRTWIEGRGGGSRHDENYRNAKKNSNTGQHWPTTAQRPHRRNDRDDTQCPVESLFAPNVATTGKQAEIETADEGKRERADGWKLAHPGFALQR
jgi:hypothetical protein